MSCGTSALLWLSAARLHQPLSVILMYFLPLSPSPQLPAHANDSQAACVCVTYTACISQHFQKCVMRTIRYKHKLLLKKDPHDAAQPQRIYNSISIRIMQPNHNSSLAHIVSILLVITQFVNTINQISTHTVPTPTNASQPDSRLETGLNRLRFIYMTDNVLMRTHFFCFFLSHIYFQLPHLIIYPT